MMDKQRESIRFHLLKANQLIDDVNVLLANERYTSIISRLYYACFHATTSFLLYKNKASRTHKGLQALLYQEFVVKNEFDAQHAKFFARLFAERMEDDYGDFYIANANDVIGFIQPAKDFILYITEIVTHEHNQQ